MKPKKRLLSLLLCVTMLFSLCPQSVSAEGSMGTACTHEHTDDCYMEVIECIHEHDENCYSEIEGSVSENDATPSNATQREPENCTHICTEESGCVVRTLNCLHEHDEDCTSSPETAAFVEGTEGDSTIQTATDSNGHYEINANTLAIEKVKAMIDALPDVSELEYMDNDELSEVYEKAQDAYDAFEALTEEQQATIIGTEVFEELFAWFNGQTMSVKPVPEITYITADGTGSATAYEMLDSNSSGTQSSGIYYVSSGFTLSSDLSFTGDTTLVLGDGITLTVEGVLSCDKNLTITTVTGATNAALTVNGGTGTDGDGKVNGYGIYSGKSLSIYAGTVNATDGDTAADKSRSYGIYVADGSLTISGSGTSVTATGGTASSGSYGIRRAVGSDSGSIRITGGTVNATGGTASSASYGIIQNYGAFDISGSAQVTAKGGKAEESYGTYTNGTMTVSDTARLTAEGDKVNKTESSYGINCVTINIGGNAEVTGKGGNVTNVSTGIACPTVTINGNAKVTAMAGTSDGNYSVGIRASDTVNISGGTVKATSGAAKSESYGIWAKSVNIADATVTAYSDGSTPKSHGIYAGSRGSTASGNSISISQTGNKTTKVYGKDNGPVSLSAYTLSYDGGELKLATDSTFTHSLSGTGDFASLLPKGYAFALRSTEGDEPAETTPKAAESGNSDIVFVLKLCDHMTGPNSARENGTCKFCGTGCEGKHDYVTSWGGCSSGCTDDKVCKHEDIDASGKCAACETQFRAKLTAGNETFWAMNVSTLMDKRTASGPNTVMLYSDLNYMPAFTTTGTAWTLDLNGHRYGGQIYVGDSGTAGSLTVSNSGAASWQSLIVGIRLVKGIAKLNVGVYLSLAEVPTGSTLGALLPAGAAFEKHASSDDTYALFDTTGVRLSNDDTLRVVAHTSHTYDSATGKCACGAVAAVCVTGGSVTTGYESFADAYTAAKNGETIKLFSNVSDAMTINDSSKNITLDLNGKTVSSLTVSVPATITDSTGGGTITTLATDGDVKIGGLLAAGYGFKDTDSKWYDSSSTETSVSNVSVQELPIKSVSISTNKYDNTFAYGEDIWLVATPMLTGTSTPTYEWMNMDGSEQTFEDKQGFWLNYLAPNEYTIQCTVTVDGYSISEHIEFTVTKATLTESDYTAPTAKIGLTYTINTDQELIRAGRFNSNVTTTGSNAPEFWYGMENANGRMEWSTVKNGRNAGTYTVHWYIAGGTNYENVGSAENPAGTFTVTIAPRTVEPTVTVAGGSTYDGTEKKPSVTVKLDGATLTENTDYTVSYENNVNAGENTAKVIVTAKQGRNYTFETVTKTFSIAKGTQTITTPTGQTIARGRSNVDVSTWASAPGTLTYTLVGTNPDGVTLENNKLTVPSSVAVNEAISIKVTAAATDNYNKAEATFTVKVKDKDDAGVTIESAPTSKTYGESFTLTASVGTGVTGGTWSWTTSDSSILEITGGADSATVTVKAKKADTTGATLTATYTSDTHYGTASATISVAKKTVTVSGITAQNKTYDGTDEAWLDTNSMVFNGKLDGDELDISVNGTYADASAGENKTVNLSYELYGGSKDNYELDTAHSQTTATANIGKATPTVTTAPAATVTYGKTVAHGDIQGAMSVGGEFAWKNVISYGDATNGTPKTLTATFTPTDTTNYNSVGVNVSVTVNKATYGDKTANGSAKYGGSNSVDLSGLIMPGGTATASIKTDTDKVLNGTPTMDGNKLQFTLANDAALVGKTADIEVSVSGCTNYTDYKITVTLTVDDKLTPTVTAPTAIENLTYNGTMQTLITAGSTNGGTLQYSLDNSTWSTALPKAKDANTYTVYYKVVGNADYADTAVNSIPVTIGKKTVTVKPKSYTITQGNTIPAFALEYDGLVDGDSLTTSAAPTFTCYEADGNTAVSTATAAGSYTITWTNSDAFDFTSETNYTVTKATTGTLTINAKPNSNDGSSDSGNDHVTYYTLTFETNGGSSIKTVSTAYGKTIDLSGYAPTRSGYDFSGWYSDKGLTNKVTKIKLTGNKTVYAGWVKHNPNTGTGNPFTDVYQNDWFYEHVMFVYGNNLMTGTSATTFEPNSSTTRAQIAVIFYRMEGSPAVEGKNNYTDVEYGPGTAWYYNAATWAQQSGIMGGYGDGKFGPNDPVTREQLAAIFYRYAQYKGYDTTQGGMAIREFDDYENISPYAMDAMTWAVNVGIMTGKGNNRLDPQGTATRAEIAAMLHRFIELYRLTPAPVAPTTGSGGNSGGTSGWVQRAGSPKTGDNTNMGLWLFTLCASAGAMTVLLFLKRREEEERMITA